MNYAVMREDGRRKLLLWAAIGVASGSVTNVTNITVASWSGCDAICMTKVPKAGSSTFATILEDRWFKRGRTRGSSLSAWEDCFRTSLEIRSRHGEDVERSAKCGAPLCSSPLANPSVERRFTRPGGAFVMSNVGNQNHRPCVAVFRDQKFVPQSIRSMTAPDTALPSARTSAAQILFINARDPVGRVLSQYSHNIQVKSQVACCGTPLEYRRLGGKGIEGKGIEWFIRAPGIDNVMTRMAANRGWTFGTASAERLDHPEDALSLAKAHLDVAHVLLLERGECSLAVACALVLGLGPCSNSLVTIKHGDIKNVNKDPHSHARANASQYDDLVLQYNDLDAELHAYAGEVLDARVRHMDINWRRKLGAFCGAQGAPSDAESRRRLPRAAAIARLVEPADSGPRSRSLTD